jgi:protein SCO1/2
MSRALAWRASHKTRLCLGVLLCGLSMACQLSGKGKGKGQLDHFGKLPEFSLQNQFGKTFTDDDLRGRVVVVDFIFTSCPDVCPLLTEQLAALRKRMPEQAPLSFVSFSVDPEHDTPERLRIFAQQHGVDVVNFWFLTGPIAEVKRVVTLGFKQAMQAEPMREGKPRNVLHGTHFVLVDQRAEIRGFFANDKEGHDALQKAVSELLSQGVDS